MCVSVCLCVCLFMHNCNNSTVKAMDSVCIVPLSLFFFSLPLPIFSCSPIQSQAARKGAKGSLKLQQGEGVNWKFKMANKTFAKIKKAIGTLCAARGVWGYSLTHSPPPLLSALIRH